MAMVAAPALKFTARRRAALLVAPAAPTPRELKLLSDVDDQQGLRFHPPIIHFYRRDTSAMDGGGGRDPAPVIRDAVAMALVHYYPLAGRLRELEGRKLAVDCTGEGVLFIEADADVRLEHFGDVVHPPLPCLEELAFDVSGSSAEISSAPLVLIQVTRLACGGFIVAVRTHHTMADAQGTLQFLQAVSELARGAAAPTVHPVWGRELLMARNPPRPSFPHREYDKVPADHHNGATVSPDAIARCSFFFGPGEVAAIRAHLPPHLRERATTFEVLTGFLWRCRTMALAPDAAAEVRVGCVVTARGGGGGGKTNGLVIPKGYYGNSFATPVAIATAGELCASPVGYAVELVRAAKAAVGAEYLRSVADHMALNGRPIFSAAGAFMVSDLTRIRFGDLDYGWGRPVYGGAASLGPMPIPGLSSFLLPVKNAKGEDGVVVPMWLPASAMDRFAKEVGKLLRRPSAAADDVPAPPQPQRRGHGVLFPAKRSAL